MKRARISESQRFVSTAPPETKTWSAVRGRLCIVHMALLPIGWTGPVVRTGVVERRGGLGGNTIAVGKFMPLGPVERAGAPTEPPRDDDGDEAANGGWITLVSREYSGNRGAPAHSQNKRERRWVVKQGKKKTRNACERRNTTGTKNGNTG